MNSLILSMISPFSYIDHPETDMAVTTAQHLLLTTRIDGETML